MQSQELASLESRLLDPLPIPIIGQCLQKKAVVSLAEDRSPEGVKVLAKALTRLKEPEIKASILDTLCELRNQNCIDAICEVWADTRHRDLANLLVKKSWVASTPINLKVITALKVNQPQMITNGGKEIVEPLLSAFEDKDLEIANRASKRAIIFDQPEYQEFLCRLVIEKDHSIARQVAIKAQYAPREPNQRALFYFLTEQWDKYETLDYEHSLLEKVYELGNEKLRKQIAEKVKQSGRAAWVHIIAGGRRGQRLEKMTDTEWEATLDILSNNKQWEEMWQLAQKAPAIWGKQLLQNLKQERWLPLVEGERIVFESLKQLADKCLDKIPSISGLISCQATLLTEEEQNRLYKSSGRIGFSPDGKIFAIINYVEGIRLWQIHQGKLITTLKRGFADHTVCFSPDGTILASHDNRTIRLWQIPQGQFITTLEPTDNEDHNHLGYIIFSPNGKIFASYDSEGKIKLWQACDGQLLTTLQSASARADPCVPSFSPDGITIAARVSTREGWHINIWQISDGQLLSTLSAKYKNKAEITTFSPDGKILASCSDSSKIRLWQISDSQLLAEFFAGSSIKRVDTIIFSPDGKILVSCSDDKIVRLWGIPDGKFLAEFHVDSYIHSTNKIAFSPDGKILACCSGTKIKLWQMSDNKLLAEFIADERSDYVEAINFSPDGKTLTSCNRCSHDLTIKLWSSDLPRLIRQPVVGLNQQNKEFIKKTLQDQKGNKQENNWLEFIQELMNWQRRFDVEVENASQLIGTGEFDIEIEG
jgi:WD40 repeat protein